MYEILVGSLKDKFFRGQVVSKKELGKDADEYEAKGFVKKVATQEPKASTKK